jgi:hypothetical protein
MDFLRMADVMRDELQNFFTAMRRGQDKADLLRAAGRLELALSRCEASVSDPERRSSLSVEQRWGFLLLFSSVQSAREALKALTALTR